MFILLSTLLLLILKLTVFINMAWWIVLLPVIFYVGIIGLWLFCTILTLIGGLILVWMDR